MKSRSCTRSILHQPRRRRPPRNARRQERARSTSGNSVTTLIVSSARRHPSRSHRPSTVRRASTPISPSGSVTTSRRPARSTSRTNSFRYGSRNSRFGSLHLDHQPRRQLVHRGHQAQRRLVGQPHREAGRARGGRPRRPRAASARSAGTARNCPRHGSSASRPSAPANFTSHSRWYARLRSIVSGPADHLAVQIHQPAPTGPARTPPPARRSAGRA